MGYNGLIYLAVFLPLSLIAYQVTPRKFRKYTLLALSWVYVFLCSKKLIVFILATTAFVYFLAHWMERVNDRKKIKARLKLFGLLALFGTLLVTNYTNFTIVNINAVMSHLTSWKPISAVDMLKPIGISFYTLEAAGYLLEVYWGRVKADHDFTRVALFLSFFPQTMEGPIARYQDTADQLVAGEGIHEKNLKEGAIRILWGLFKKMVVADRLNTLVAVLYTNRTEYHGVMITVAAVAYAIQLYMEFSGVMDIVIGSGKMFNVTLPENFRQPFFAKNASEFWRRWHISLGTWLKTYVFYPVTTSHTVKKWNKFSRKKLNKYIGKIGTSALALFPVWLFNGIWHGPQWNYIFYGMFYFVILMLEVILDPVKQMVLKALHTTEENSAWRMLMIVKTWFIIFTGELFFRAESLTAGFQMFFSTFKDFSLRPLTDGSLTKLGLDQADLSVVVFGIIVVFIYDFLKERNVPLGEIVDAQKLPVRWAIYYIGIFAIIILGAYGAGYQQVDLIYAGF